MKIVDSLSDLLEDGARFALREELLAKDFIQQFSSGQQLCHHINMAAIVVNLQRVAILVITDTETHNLDPKRVHAGYPILVIYYSLPA